jgi:hypothetical protein
MDAVQPALAAAFHYALYSVSGGPAVEKRLEES